MKIGSMMNDVMTSLFRHPVTEKYPFERPVTPERLRGHLRWDSQNCTGCGLCTMECPAQAVEMIVLDKKAKRFVMRYHIDRCTFCAQCVNSCNRNCLSMSPDIWELAALGRESFTVYFGDPEDIDSVLAGSASTGF